ncbi:MAG TPA: SGNH/GDSL hydrolase family protein, partial [Pyrinomonadaceae bacterium]|nr:SGNH/GDSL hydrolase family protein [Pyrinomonadaceae bacterium]
MRLAILLYGIERTMLALLILAAITSATASCAPHTLYQKEEQSGMANNMANNKADAPVVYVALGDSTGAGTGARHGGYVARLFERIKMERPASSLINLCVSGATTDDVLREQVGPGTRARPTLLTLGIGINDAGRGVAVERFARNYEEIVKRLRAGGDSPIVVTNLPDVSLAPVVPVFMRGEVRRRIELYNQRIAEIAGRYNLLVVDAYTVTHEVIPSHPEFFSEDGFHPSDVGYEYWAKTM